MTLTHHDTRTTLLRVFDDTAPGDPRTVTSDASEIAALLAPIGVRFERWRAGVDLPAGASQEHVLAAYESSVERLKRECGYQTADALRVEHGATDTAPLRARFLNEHTHSEDEVRFFVEGRGAFYLHANERVYQIVCVRGDLLGVPAGMRHWFDLGANPQLCVIRLFTNPDGWVADFTGEPIADRFPKLGAVDITP
jgi:1,2-dihydroxy-3-keto-5-methylthiopentene dioxygenase